MKIHFYLEDHETTDDINNFTVANAILKACNQSKTHISEQKAMLDADVIAKMLLLQCEKLEELKRGQK